MTCIGDPAVFALEYENLHSGDRWLLGSVRAVVAGVGLGDTSQTVVLGTLERFLGGTLTANLSAPSLAGLPASLVLAQVFEPLYGGGAGDLGYERLAWSPNGLEAFDGIYAVLLDAGDQYRFVWAQRPDGAIGPAWRTPELCRESWLPREAYRLAVGRVLEDMQARRAYPRSRSPER